MCFCETEIFGFHIISLSFGCLGVLNIVRQTGFQGLGVGFEPNVFVGFLGYFMNKIQSDQLFETIETTIGDLIEAITQVALETGKTENEGYALASLAIESILRRNTRDVPQLN